MRLACRNRGSEPSGCSAPSSPLHCSHGRPRARPADTRTSHLDPQTRPLPLRSTARSSPNSSPSQRLRGAPCPSLKRAAQCVPTCPHTLYDPQSQPPAGCPRPIMSQSCRQARAANTGQPSAPRPSQWSAAMDGARGHPNPAPSVPSPPPGPLPSTWPNHSA